MNSDEQSLIEEDLLFEEDEDNEDEIYLTVEKRYKQRYESEYDKWQNEKTLRQELVKEKLSKKSMPDLVKRVYEYEQRERLSTDALGAQAMVMSGNNFMKMQDCKILDDSVLETVVAGEKKEVAILFDPIQLTINMRKYWTPGGDRKSVV